MVELYDGWQCTADQGGQNKMIGFSCPHRRHLEYIEMISQWVVGGGQL
jgi:hypothetical protein